MMGDIIPALVTGGLGAAIGTIGTAVIQSVSGRGEARAVAADRVTNAAGNLADRLDKFNTKLDRENRQLRLAVAALCEAVEDILPIIEDEGVRERVHRAVLEARKVF